MKNFCIIFILLWGNYCLGQNIPSPNAAAMGIFGEYPQSGFTGVPDISIPVYTMNYGGKDFPIRLSYNTNMVKPNSLGSWVGLGWNLSVGGAITRVVNDRPDDINYQGNGSIYDVGFFYNHSYLSNSNWTETSKIIDALTDYSGFDPIRVLDHDYTPDEFSFSVGDLSGCFYMDHDGYWKVRSNTRIKVDQPVISDFNFVYAGPGMPDHLYLKRIAFTDTKGIRYIFGGSNNSIERTDLVVKTWYLTSIILPNGKTVNFNYELGESFTISQPLGWVGSDTLEINQDFKTAYLRSVKTDLHEIKFFRSQNSDEFSKLDSIQVNNASDSSQVKKFIFSYLGGPMDSLKLTSVSQKDAMNQLFSIYSFAYNSLQMNRSSTPGIYVNTDQWGYNSTFSLNAGTRSAFESSKYADTTHCRAELLKRITYPTGGYTEYTWEPNDYAKIVGDIRSDADSIITYGSNKYDYAGGVRIKQITNYDAGTIIGKKKYSYIQNYSSSHTSGLSSGVLYSKPRYNYISSLRYSYNPYLPFMENNQGSHISYSEVTEIEANGSYTTTRYSNFDTGSSLLPNEYMDEPALNIYREGSQGFKNFQEYISNSHERGAPLSVKIYSATDSLIEKQITEYERINKSSESARAYYLLISGRIGQMFSYHWGAALKIYTNAFLPKKVTQTIFDVNGQNPVTTITEYQHSSTTLNLIQREFTNSAGSTYTTRYTYPDSFVGHFPYADPSSAPYDTLVSRNIIDPLVSETVYKGTGYTDILKSNRTQYALWGDNSYPSAILRGTPSGYLVSSWNPRTDFLAYDDQGNVLMTGKHDGPTTCYVWGYAGQFLIAKIENAGYSSVETLLGGSTDVKDFRDLPFPSDSDVNTFLSSLRSSLPGSLVTTYTYKPLIGMTSMTDPRGKTTTYEYDKTGRLKNIKDQDNNIVKSFEYHFKP